MRTVIVQVQGFEAIRVDEPKAADYIAEIQEFCVGDVYVTDCHNRVWAPCDDFWILWEQA